jgi:hypothetical protein
MKKIITVLFFLSLIFTGCNGQKNKNTKDTSGKKQPETNIIVNKEYDEDGNIIRYDSTYSSYYSNIENNQFVEDSIFNSFRNHFNERYSFSNDPFFNNIFFEDSLLNFDFYKKDFFKDRFNNNWQHMNKLFQEMDSIKNNYFRYQFQDTIKHK